MNPRVAQEIAVTWNIMNGELSDPAKQLLLRTFSEYEDGAILLALERVRSECRGRITPADVIQRIDDGRPGPEEAWSIAQAAFGNENATVVWTPEISEAFYNIREMSDKISARKAFLESYRRIVTTAKVEKRPIKWNVSLGGDSAQRVNAVRAAYNKGYLTAARAQKAAPELQLEITDSRQLPAHEECLPSEKIKELCQGVINNSEV